MGGRPASPATRTVTIHGLILFVRLIEFSGFLCFTNMIITEARTVQYVPMKTKRVLLLSIEASIIHLRLKTEDRAMISISLFFVICMILPRTPLAKIPTRTAVFIMNIRI